MQCIPKRGSLQNGLQPCTKRKTYKPLTSFKNRQNRSARAAHAAPPAAIVDMHLHRPTAMCFRAKLQGWSVPAHPDLSRISCSRQGRHHIIIRTKDNLHEPVSTAEVTSAISIGPTHLSELICGDIKGHLAETLSARTARD